MSPPTEQIQVDRPTVIDEIIDDEVVVVDLQRGSYYSIRGAGVDIWRLLAGPTTAEDVATQIAARFGRSDPDVVDIVLRFVSELDEHGLLRTVAGDDTRAPNIDLPAGDPPDFEPPRLEKFTDMEDLLLLDPVHDVDGRGWPHPDPH